MCVCNSPSLLAHVPHPPPSLPPCSPPARCMCGSGMELSSECPIKTQSCSNDNDCGQHSSCAVPTFPTQAPLHASDDDDGDGDGTSFQNGPVRRRRAGSINTCSCDIGYVSAGNTGAFCTRADPCSCGDGEGCVALNSGSSATCAPSCFDCEGHSSCYNNGEDKGTSGGRTRITRD